jgi:enoyl-CoA hydratase
MNELLTERSGNVLTLTLNRPEKMNALSASLVEALLAEVSSAASSGIRLLILKGAGRNFSAGFDLGEFETESEGDLVLRFIRIEALLQALYHAPFDTLALAHGKNFGAGVDIICSCGRRIADEAASFQMPGLRFGLVLGTRRYAERVGRTTARHILQEGVAFNSMAALAAGFLTEITAQNFWDDAASDAVKAAASLTAEAQTRLFTTLGIDSRDNDLADLVRSAAAPGLKQRIAAYRNFNREKPISA